MSRFEGRVLYINLSTASFRKDKIESRIIDQYIGGRGLGGYLALKEIPAHVDPLGPENRLMFITGPLAGTPFPGTGKFVVVTRSPATGTFCDSHSSGLLAPALRFSGYDIVIINGKAPSPIYLWIEDDKISFCPADDLWGLDTYATETILRDRHGHVDTGVAVIGPAGENLVKFASISSDFYRQAARGGVGAVMGSKNLKALVVRGTGSIPVAQPKRMKELQLQQIAKLPNSPGGQSRIKYGTTASLTITNAAGMLPTRNFQQGTCPEATGTIDAAGFLEVTTGVAGCYGCMMPCGRLLEVDYKGKKLRLEGPEYETIGLMGPNIGVTDRGAIASLNILCDRLGLDTISAASVLAFTMECAERSLLNDPALAGLHFGDADAAEQLLEAIAQRRGFGNLMAEGVKEMSCHIKQGSDHFAMHVKGLELPAYDPRAGFGTGLTYAVAPRGGCHRRAWPPAKEVLGNVPPYTTVGKAAMVKETFDKRAILHSLVACDFHPDALPITMVEYRDFVEAATSYAYTLSEWAECADRIETIIRLFNVREGFTRADDTLPQRLLKDPLPDGPARGQLFGQEGLDHMLDEYYALRGWDNEGIPTAETLKRYEISTGKI